MKLSQKQIVLFSVLALLLIVAITIVFLYQPPTPMLKLNEDGERMLREFITKNTTIGKNSDIDLDFLMSARYNEVTDRYVREACDKSKVYFEGKYDYPFCPVRAVDNVDYIYDIYAVQFPKSINFYEETSISEREVKVLADITLQIDFYEQAETDSSWDGSYVHSQTEKELKGIEFIVGLNDDNEWKIFAMPNAEIEATNHFATWGGNFSKSEWLFGDVVGFIEP